MVSDGVISGAQVREFYDAFRDSRMVRYRLKANLRIERAIERVSEYVHPGSRVLEIGCGIGIIAERLAAKLRDGQLWACDISPRNIEMARETVKSDKVAFFVADVSSGLSAVEEQLDGAVDVVVMIDVLEHLPRAIHPDLFTNLRRIMRQDSVVVLTYPSPQYQRYLREHEPRELQVIDEVIEVEELLCVAKAAGYSLRLFSLEDVWRRNQYVHCVFQSSVPVDRITSVSPTRLGKLFRRFRAVLDHRSRLTRSLRRSIVDDARGRSST
jgi:trans-aconitate 2-methyltransferase